MTMIMSPLVFSNLNGGLMGYVIIAESHVAYHFQPPDHHWLDVFSCKPFDGEAVDAYAIKHFRLRQWKVEEVMRGN